MKREYNPPAFKVVNISPTNIIATSAVTSVGGNGGINYGGGGNGIGRAPGRRGIWD